MHVLRCRRVPRGCGASAATTPGAKPALHCAQVKLSVVDLGAQEFVGLAGLGSGLGV